MRDNEACLKLSWRRGASSISPDWSAKFATDVIDVATRSSHGGLMAFCIFAHFHAFFYSYM
ncbi:hypothetical protein E2C01_035057 [Portunus trituberculatus]|uniref:Uncharacterized protein n=1 Tax=Portunus trituberculatus TaxID=210409 RepID=A0A5B7F799_PORTR|nr:hypothetical protein [Portunus trituberculatus]